MSLYDTLLDKLEGRQYSNYFSCYCIFDEHKSPALLVYDDGWFVCQSCGKKGNLTYLDKMLGSHFRPISVTRSQSNILPRWRKWQEKYGDLEGIAKHAHQSLKRFPQFQGYFKKRKIDEFMASGYFGYIDGWILFPAFSRDKKIVDIVVRAGAGKGNTRYVLVSGDTDGIRNLYCPNWSRVEKAETVVVCFGVIDSWSFESLGIGCVTGTTGKSLSAELLKKLGKKFIIVPDDGEFKEAHLLANKLGWRAKVLNLKFPENTKDPDDIRNEYGNDFLMSLLVSGGLYE